VVGGMGTSTEEPSSGVTHPAQWSAPILEQLRLLLAMVDPGRWFDPFAGVGLDQLRMLRPDIHWVGYEIEQEWAASDPNCIVGDSTKTDWPDAYFDGLVTSPAYGNRMADSYDGRDGSDRRTYRLSLGRELSDNSGAALQWGNAYRVLHEKAWREAHRYLCPGAPALINVKNHMRGGRVIDVVGWHTAALEEAGFQVVGEVAVKTSGFRKGANYDARADHEVILVCRR